MNELSDQQLLRDYAERHSDAAFAELVRRHVHLVYSTALRMACEAHSAEDVSQAVFVALAQNAASLAEHPVLSGWLHCTARNLAAKSVRSEVRRRAREQEAAMNQLLSAEPDAAWEHVAPYLDEALGALSVQDRDALLLRYFERKSALQMADVLGITDEAAQKRAARAVERLRELFAKRGVTIGASGLIAAITANAVQTAPAELIATLSSPALAVTAIPSTALAAVKTTIAMTTIQKAVISASLAAALGTGVYEARQASHLHGQVQALRQQQAPLAEEIQKLRQEREDANSRMASMAGEISALKSNSTDLLKLRGEIGRLRQQTNELGKLREENHRLAARLGANQAAEGGASEGANSQHFVPKDSWTFAGRSTPENALQSQLWAMFKPGDTNALEALLDGMTPELRGGKEDGLRKLWASPDATSELPNITGFRVIEKFGVSDEATVLRVQIQTPQGARSENFMFKRLEGEWKAAPLLNLPR